MAGNKEVGEASGESPAEVGPLKAPLAGKCWPSRSQPAGHEEVVSLWPNGVSPTVKLMQRFSGAGTAGRSAEAKYKTLASAWRRRLLGRRAPMYFWGIFAVALIAVVSAHPSGRWGLYAGFVFGAAAVTWILLPDAVMPHQVFKWQLGAWGEQKTASELRRLERDGWLIRHDVAWGERSNHDHVVAGPAVYVVNSKNLPARHVSITGLTIRVCAVDDPSDSYVADR
jgi:Nuclease-related domain